MVVILVWEYLIKVFEIILFCFPSAKDKENPTVPEIPMSEEVKVILAQGQGQAEGQMLMGNSVVLTSDTQVGICYTFIIIVNIGK